MNVSQIVNMVMRLFLRKSLNWGINKGTQMVSKRSKPGVVPPKADAQQSTQARDTAKRARKAAAITRRTLR